tara:strand:- start:3632 stop:4234 length:603 start_codon:yes stop_codon:yes gene_type:complete
MFDITLINKNKSNCIILIHGLFSNPGFWLKYLRLFKGSCLVLVSVNYDRLPDIDVCIGDLKRSLSCIIDSKLKNKLIAHSLGTYVALKLGTIPNVESYHICPVYLAKRKNRKMFVDFINEMQPILSHHEIYETLQSVNSVLNFEKKLVFNAYKTQLRSYIPKRDLFFEYSLTGSEINFDGDHFDVYSALKEISQNSEEVL